MTHPIDVRPTILRSGTVHFTRADYRGSQPVRVTMCLAPVRKVHDASEVRVLDADPLAFRIRCYGCKVWRDRLIGERRQLRLAFNS